MERARERPTRRHEAPRTAAKRGLWERLAKGVNVAWAVSFTLYLVSGLILIELGLLKLGADPPMLLYPTLTTTAVLVLLQLGINGFDALVRLWDKEVGGPSIALILLGPCTGGITSFVYWALVGRRPHATPCPA
jgi:hypothetical protein